MDRNDYIDFRDIFLETLRDATYTKEIDVLVDSFIHGVKNFFSFDSCEIYLRCGDYFILRGIAGLDRYFVCKIMLPTNSGLGERISNSMDAIILDNQNNSEFNEFSKFKKMMALPIGIFSENFGYVLVRINDEDEKKLFEAKEALMNLITHFAVYANAILNTFNSDHRKKQLLHLEEEYIHLESANSIAEIEKDLALSYAKVFDARKCIVRIHEDGGTYRLSSSWGIDPIMIPYTMREDDPVIKTLSDNQYFLFMNEHYNPFGRDYMNGSKMMGLLISHGNIIGLVKIIDKIPSATNPLGHFLEDDRDLFRKLNLQVANRIERENVNAMLSKVVSKNEKINRKLYILYEATNALLGHSKLEDILFILLTSATIGDAFGFNRAFLYMYDEQQQVFKGEMGVAPINAEDAYRIWNEITLNQGKTTLMENILIGLSEKDIHENVELNVKLNNSILPADESCPVLKRLVETKSIQNIHSPKEETSVSLHTDLFGSIPFAMVPVISQKKLIGMLVVDNSFNKEPIYEEDLEYLKMFANQTGIAIEYSFLYDEIAQRERELKHTQNKLNEAQRLAIIGEMSSSIAHDLRNSIVSIGGFASRMRRMEQLPERAKKYSEIIHEEVSKLEEYLRKNLTFAKKIKLNMEEIKIAKMIDMISIIVKERIKQSGKKVKYSAKVEEGLDTLVCDYTQIHDVLLNIVINAIDAVADDGAFIFLEAKMNNQDIKDKQFLTLQISNTHSYIENSKLQKIFDPFYTTKSSGVGLGLATAKRIIEAHGGEITVASEKNAEYANGRTVFTITIPFEH